METIDLKYPIMLVHGTAFRDRKYINYWGRIPAALESAGISVLYGNQDSWGSIETNAEVLKNNLMDYLRRQNCEKVNIIAHSKGGLDARCLIAKPGMAKHVASLTTICTPHHGSYTMDKLLNLPEWLFRILGFCTNSWYRIIGDRNPDFRNTVKSFSTEYAKEFNKNHPDAEGIFYQSYAAAMKNPFSDMVMFLPNLVVNFIEGENDGLVTTASARWTNFQGVLRGTSNRGVSHTDEVDLRRRNLTKNPKSDGVYDIRLVYLDICRTLSEMGL